MTPRTKRSSLLASVIVPVLLLTISGCAGVSAPASSSAASGSAPQPHDSHSHSHSADSQPDDAVVTIGLKFMPEDLTVKVGTTVTWQNGEAIGHTVTSGAWGDVNESTGLRGSQTPDGLFDHDLSPKGQDGDTFTFTFDEPGVYQYYCQPHLTMNATVTVEQ